MPGRLARFLIILMLVMIAAPTGLVRPVGAQQDVEFTTIEATANFPETIRFELEARTDLDVEAVQVFWRTAESSVTTMADADFTAGGTLQATHIVDMGVRYLPPGLDLVYYWNITASDGTVYRSPEETLFYMDTRFDWDTVEAGLVNVWWYQGSEEYAAEIAHSANRTLLMLKTEFGLQTTEPIRILAYASGSDFSGALAANSADWIGGVAHSSLSLILGHIAPGGRADEETSRMIPHEVAHVVVAHSSENPYNSPPPWLDEGLATFIQEVDDPRLEPVLDRAVREGRLIPVGALRSSFPANPDQALLSYAESQSILTYLVETYGKDTVGDLVSVYQQGVDHDGAPERVIGISVDELDAAWKAWLGYEGDQVVDPYIAASDPEGPGTVWFVVVFGAVTLFAGGLVAFFFWRTRSYKDSDEPDQPGEATEPLV